MSCTPDICEVFYSVCRRRTVSLQVDELLPELLFFFGIRSIVVPLPDPILFLPLCLDTDIWEVVDDVGVWKVGIDTCTFQAGLLGDLSHSQTLGIQLLNLAA